MMEGSPNAVVHHQSPPHHRQPNVNRGLIFRVPRHNYNFQHSQRNVGQHYSTSNSHRKNNPSFKYGQRSDSRSGNTERRGKGTQKQQERIRSNRVVIDVVSGDEMKMSCGLCSASTHNSVAAVLVCGHIYHADCLETTTPYEDRRDPPCPLCINSHI